MSQKIYPSTVNNIRSEDKLVRPLVKNGLGVSDFLPKLYLASDVVAFFSIALVLYFSEIISQAVTFSVVATCVVVWLGNAAHYRMRMPFWTEFKHITNILMIALLVDSFLQFNYHMESSPLILLASWVSAGLAIVGLRMIVRKFAVTYNLTIPTIIIGSGALAQSTEAYIRSSPELGYNIVARIKNLPEQFIQHGSSWQDLCEDYGAKHVIVALEAKDIQNSEKIIAKLMRTEIGFSIVPVMSHLPVAGMVEQYSLGNHSALLTHDSGHKQLLSLLAKRGLDVMVSGVALFLLSPLILLIAMMIKRDGGDAFFGHNRLGRNGKIFPCLKFRSMVMGGDKILKEHLENNPEAAEEWKATQKLVNDPRVTRIGKFLRSTSIDELPQLINVLRGDMSLVGPRPIVRDEIAHYSHDIDYYYRVRPGVTGLWQVSGRSDTTYAQRVQLDSWYVRNWSLWHDIVIILKTFPAVLKGSGAY